MRHRLQPSIGTSNGQLRSAAVRTGRHWLLSVLLCVMLGLTTGCVSPKDSSSNADSYQSGGIGLTLAEWERRYNLSPIETPVPLASYVRYAERDYDVGLWYDRSEGQSIRDALIYVIGFDSQSSDPDEQHAEGRSYLPADAVLQEIYVDVSNSGGYIARYHSKSLAARYPPLPLVPDPWEGSVPGTIRVRYGWGGTGVGAALQELPPLREPTEPPPTKTPFILLPTPLPTEPQPPSPVPSLSPLLEP
jgi:hypothetical protein